MLLCAFSADRILWPYARRFSSVRNRALQEVASGQQPQQMWRRHCRWAVGVRTGCQSLTITAEENWHSMHVQEQGAWDLEELAAAEEASAHQLCSGVSRQVLEGEPERASAAAAPWRSTRDHNRFMAGSVKDSQDEIVCRGIRMVDSSWLVLIADSDHVKLTFRTGSLSGPLNNYSVQHWNYCETVMHIY